MSKLVFISNRLPITIEKKQSGFEYSKSIGGLATGLKSYHEHSDSIWAGWPGITDSDTTQEERAAITHELNRRFKCLPVFLSEEEIDKYYFGFSNKTIWPLFHYFTNKTEYDYETWRAYQDVNRKFFETVDPLIDEDDTIWIHDYQLMLLPGMIKEKHPDAKVGFFLHIPFSVLRDFPAVDLA